MKTLEELGTEYKDYHVMVDTVEYAADCDRSYTTSIFLGTVKQIVDKYGFAHAAEIDNIEHLIFLDEVFEEL